MFIASNIVKTYSLRGEIQIPVLTGLNLSIEKGESIVIYGGNGTGKSTFLNIISGKDDDYDGEIVFNEKSLDDIPKHKKALMILEIQQKRGEGLPEMLTLFEVYMLVKSTSNSIFLINNKKKNENDLKNILLDFNLGLEKLIHRQIISLSGGEYQLFNMILLREKIKNNNDYIILLDEHTSHLDPIILNKVMKITKEIISSSNITSIIISHSVNQGILFSKKCSVLKDGKLISMSGETLNNNELKVKILNHLNTE